MFLYKVMAFNIFLKKDEITQKVRGDRKSGILMSIDCTNLTVARHQKLKEITQKTKSKRVTRTPPTSGSMDQVHRQVSVIFYLAENAQEFIFVHIPKKIWEITPSDKKNWPYHFFLRYYAYGMSGYVNTLVYFYLAPYSRQERQLKGQYITEILLKSDV